MADLVDFEVAGLCRLRGCDSPGAFWPFFLPLFVLQHHRAVILTPLTLAGFDFRYFVTSFSFPAGKIIMEVVVVFFLFIPFFYRASK